MTISAYLSFFVLVFTMVYSPGPMTLFMMANGMKMQYRNVWPILLGANNAYLISIIVFTAGLTQILQQNVVVWKVVQIVGIVYLLYLAYVQWNKKNVVGDLSSKTEDVSRKSTLYGKGALIALSNPKTIVLFGVIFPQFITADKNRLLQIIIYGLTFLVLQLSSGLVYAYFGRRINNLVEKPSCQNVIHKVSAIVLIIVAGFLLIRI
ncbi:MAG TPA: LysE family translocator [Gammaproteobacteria bacterium]|nr:LysE family translocator [Gammaproteobacteria bacterium]